MVEFTASEMRVKVHRVQIAHREFAYEVDVHIRKGHEWVKVGTIRQSDSRLLVDLLWQVEVYVNGLH